MKKFQFNFNTCFPKFCTKQVHFMGKKTVNKIQDDNYHYAIMLPKHLKIIPEV